MKENLSKKSWNFEPDQNFAKCPKLVREAPSRIPKNQQHIGPKWALDPIWAQGPCLLPGSSCYLSRILRYVGPCEGRRHEAAAREIRRAPWAQEAARRPLAQGVS